MKSEHPKHASIAFHLVRRPLVLKYYIYAHEQKEHPGQKRLLLLLRVMKAFLCNKAPERTDITDASDIKFLGL